MPTIKIADTCNEWTNIRQQQTAGPTTYWIQGFIAAYNQYEYTGSNPKGVMGNSNEADIETWLDNYCQKNTQSNPRTAI